MHVLELTETELVGGGQPSMSNVITAVGLGIAVATAPAWGSVCALVALAAVAVKTLEQ